MGHNKKKHNGTKYIGFLAFFVLGIVCAVQIGGYLAQLPEGDNYLGNELLLTGFVMLLIYAAMYLQIVIHEAGHLLFGRLTGYRFSSFRVGNFMWIKDGNRLKCKRLTVAGTGGQCLMIPPDMVEGKLPVVLYNLGGPIMNFVAAALFYILYALMAHDTLLPLFFLLMALTGVGYGLINGIPMRLGPVDNDGYNALSLGKTPEALRAFWIQMKVNHQVSMGVRLRDMPEEWFDIPSDEGMQNSMIATIGVLACNRLMDQHRFIDADSLMERLLSIDSGMIGIHRNLLICDRMYCELIGENRSAVLDRYYTKEQKRFMKGMKTNPSVIRTEYGYALLSQHDDAAVQNAMQRFEKCAKTYPYPSDIESERELMDVAAEILAETNN